MFDCCWRLSLPFPFVTLPLAGEADTKSPVAPSFDSGGKFKPPAEAPTPALHF